MKGVIADCLKKLVIEKFGNEKWKDVMKLSNLPEEITFLPTSDIDDKSVMLVIKNTCSVLNIDMQKAADVFGDYWVNKYAPKIYGIYYKKFRSAKEFILGMDKIHEITTQTITNAHPPRFQFETIDEKTVVVSYKSSRNMIDFYIGLVKGVGNYFNSQLEVQKLSDSKAKIVFDK